MRRHIYIYTDNLRTLFSVSISRSRQYLSNISIWQLNSVMRGKGALGRKCLGYSSRYVVAIIWVIASENILAGTSGFQLEHVIHRRRKIKLTVKKVFPCRHTSEFKQCVFVSQQAIRTLPHIIRLASPLLWSYQMLVKSVLRLRMDCRVPQRGEMRAPSRPDRMGRARPRNPRSQQSEP